MKGKVIKRLLAGLVVALVVSLVIFWDLVSYGVRQGYGQFGIIWNAKPVEEFLADPEFPDSLKARLNFISEVRRYSIDSLGLKDTENYKTMFDQKGKEIMGELCVAGRCGSTSCPSGQYACGGKCIDPWSDRNFCGAAQDCTGGAICGTGQICYRYVCEWNCPDGTLACGGKCIDPQSDRAYCGATDWDCPDGVACASGEVCSAGKCVSSCAPGLVKCAGSCVDPQVDPLHCGVSATCTGGARCGSGEVCVAGACRAGAGACQAPEIACGGRCVDPAWDRSFCGAASDCSGGTICPGTQVCVSGACTWNCPASQLTCGGRCVDPLTDPSWCGAASDCTGGSQCGPGLTCFAGQCRTPACAGTTILGATVVPGFGGAVDVVVADANRDGIPDLLLASGGVVVPPGNGDGTMKSGLISATGFSNPSLAVGDFNRDGMLDVALPNGADAYSASVLLGNGDGTFQPKVDYATGSQPEFVAIGDLNADGKLDLVSANSMSGTVSVLLGRGDGTFNGAVNYAVGSAPNAVAIADLPRRGMTLQFLLRIALHATTERSSFPLRPRKEREAVVARIKRSHVQIVNAMIERNELVAERRMRRYLSGLKDWLV
jgi:hypothetical protein